MDQQADFWLAVVYESMHDWFISNIIIFDFSFLLQNPEFKVVSLSLKAHYELVMILSPTSLISLPVTLISF